LGKSSEFVCRRKEERKGRGRGKAQMIMKELSLNKFQVLVAGFWRIWGWIWQ